VAGSGCAAGGAPIDSEPCTRLAIMLARLEAPVVQIVYRMIASGEARTWDFLSQAA